MTEINNSTPEDDCQDMDETRMVDGGIYEIKIKGHLDQQWADGFGEMKIHHDPCGVTVLTGQIVDQSALHGILIRIRDLGLILVSVSQQTNRKS